MKIRILAFAFVYAFLTTAFSVLAQTKDMPWAVGLRLGISEYYGDMGNGFFKFNISGNSIYNSTKTGTTKNTPGVLGLTVSRYLNKNFDAALAFTGGEWGYYDNINRAFFRAHFMSEANIRWKFLGEEDKRFTPYLMTGIGHRYVKMPDNEFGIKSQNELIIPLGIGLNTKLTDKIFLNLQSNYGWTSGDRAEGAILYDRLANDQFWYHTIGVAYLLGKVKDSDGDGISDKKDQCANTPAGALVDAKGCILDMDKDGIADNLDDCPATAGIAAFKGCPDSDNDGIKDSEDACPSVPGIAKFKGCPDTDGDGIQDSEDKCPTVAGLSQFNGCPDSDGDGIEDAKDDCPKLKGIAAFNGCPDTDNDGISDNKDKCPLVAGPQSNNGCPEIKAAVKQVFERALQGVQFETGKSTIKANSFAILNQVVKVLKENPDYRLFIAGHTDNVGNADKNLQLSTERAKSVENYLLKNGIEARRLNSNGYGDTQPVADNKTAAGRTKNRRVEFKVQFEDFVK